MTLSYIAGSVNARRKVYCVFERLSGQMLHCFLPGVMLSHLESRRHHCIVELP